MSDILGTQSLDEQRGDQRWTAGARSVKPKYRYATGFHTEYPHLDDLWPTSLIQRQDDDPDKMYVDFSRWPEDAPSCKVPGHDTLVYMPFPWETKSIQKAQKNTLVQAQVNTLVAMEAIPFYIFTPTLYLMVNGLPVPRPPAPGKPPAAPRLPKTFPRVLSTLDVMCCYQMVEQLFTTNTDKNDAARIASCRAQFNHGLLLLKANVQEALKQLTNADDYAKRLFELVREANGDVGVLANLDWDHDVLEEMAQIYISYQLIYIHLMEVFLIRLLMPSARAADFPEVVYTNSALPSAHPYGLFEHTLQEGEQGLLEEALAILKIRATKFKVDVELKSISAEQRVCGLPAHFFRLLYLILTH